MLTAYIVYFELKLQVANDECYEWPLTVVTVVAHGICSLTFTTHVNVN